MTAKEREALIAKAYSQIAEAQIAMRIAEDALEKIAAAEVEQATPWWGSGTATTVTLDLSGPPSGKVYNLNIVKGTD